jgi:hypothetical protein
MELSLKFPPTPEYAAQHAELMIQPARDISGVDLDFSPGSLEAIDRIIDQMRLEGVRSDQVAETLFGFGCYVGEVFVRSNGACWRPTDETGMAGLAGFPIVVELGPDNICNPIGKVFKRLENGDEDSLVYFYRVFGGESSGLAPRPAPPNKTGFLGRLFGISRKRK